MSMNVSKNSINMKFLYAGIVIAILISIAAPFLASPDPDGLESAAGGVIDEATFSGMEESAPFVESPMPDYSIDGMGKMGEILAIVIGTLLVLGISYGLGKIAKK